MITRRTSDPDGSDYLSIETDVGDQPSAAPDAAFGHGAELRSAAFGAAISVPQPSQLVSLPPGGPGASPSRRLLPIAAVVGGAAALLVVGLAVVGDRAPRHAPARRPPLAAAAPAGTAAQARDPRRHRPSEPYGAAIGGHEHELDQCAREHPDALPPDATATIVVGVDGRARQVALQPLGADQTVLGGCIRRVLQTVAFPAALDEKEDLARPGAGPLTSGQNRPPSENLRPPLVGAIATSGGPPCAPSHWVQNTATSAVAMPAAAALPQEEVGAELPRAAVAPARRRRRRDVGVVGRHRIERGPGRDAREDERHRPGAERDARRQRRRPHHARAPAARRALRSGRPASPVEGRSAASSHRPP